MAEEYISRKAAVAALLGDETVHIQTLSFAQKRIEAIPAANVTEVKHGHWIVSRTESGWTCTEYATHCKCSQCEKEIRYVDRDNYCPHCGIKMDIEWLMNCRQKEENK